MSVELQQYPAGIMVDGAGSAGKARRPDSKKRGRAHLVYQVMKAHTLSGEPSMNNIIDFGIRFRDFAFFEDTVPTHLRQYARFMGCECGAALFCKPRRLNAMGSFVKFAQTCVCSSDYLNLRGVRSPDFLGTRITLKTVSQDDISITGSTLGDECGSDLAFMSEESGSESGNCGYNLADPTSRCSPAPTPPASRDGTTQPSRRASDNLGTSGIAGRPNLERLLKESNYFCRMVNDSTLNSMLDSIIVGALAVDEPRFLKRVCEQGSLFAELLVQSFTRLSDCSVPDAESAKVLTKKTSSLLKYANTKVAAYLVALWNPEKEHDFVYRASLRAAVDADDAFAFELLAPPLTHMFQQTYRPRKFLLLDLVQRKCWRILRHIIDTDMLGSQLRHASGKKDKTTVISLAPRPAGAEERPSTTPEPGAYTSMLKDVSDAMDYSSLLNMTVQVTSVDEHDREIVKLENVYFDYFKQYLPAPAWLTEVDGRGAGTFLMKYYQELTPLGLKYLLSGVEANTINWRDCASRSLATEIRWGSKGREKLLMLLDSGLKLPKSVFEGIERQREYWKVTDRDLEMMKEQLTK